MRLINIRSRTTTLQMTTTVKRITALTIILAWLNCKLEQILIAFGSEFLFRTWHTGKCKVTVKETFLEGISNLLGRSTEDNSHGGYIYVQTPHGELAIRVPNESYERMHSGVTVSIRWQISRLNSRNLNGKLVCTEPINEAQ
jgi:hypothetical protein